MSPVARNAVQPLALFAWTIALVAAIDVTASGQSPLAETVDQIGRRIRDQREENLRAVHALLGQLSARLGEQRTLLAKHTSRLRALGCSAPDPDQELLALEEQL